MTNMSVNTMDPSKFAQYTRQELERLCYNYSCMIAKQEERMREVNELLASNLAEIRQLKEINRKLNVDNKQLQDLCCFIDNERLEGRKLAKEWQKFGRYSADVVKKEVPQYREKVKQLESLQECILDSLGIVLDMYTSSTFEIVPQQSTQVADGRRASFDMNTSVSSSETSNRGYWQPESAYSERSASDASQISQNSSSFLPVQTVVHRKDTKVPAQPAESEVESVSGSTADLSTGTDFSRNGTPWARSSNHNRYHRKRYSSKTSKVPQNMETRDIPYMEEPVFSQEPFSNIEIVENGDVRRKDDVSDQVITGASIEVCQIEDSSSSPSEEESAEDEDSLPENRNYAPNSGCLATL